MPESPEESLVGEVRQKGERLVVLSDSLTNDPWIVVTDNMPGDWWRLKHEDVNGWAVIGSVPGTPAAGLRDA